MAQLFTRLTGDQDVRSLKTKAAVAIAIGDLVTIDDDTYNIHAAGTDKLVTGIALDAKTSDTTTTNIRYDMIKPGDIVRAKIAAGTGGAQSEVGSYVDLVGAGVLVPCTGITVTESNNDARVVAWNGDAAYLDIEFTTLTASGPATATVSD
jgi:hypothetical protein